LGPFEVAWREAAVKFIVALGAAALAAGTPSQAGAEAWRQAAPMESARIQIRSAVVGGEIYVAGGATLSGQSDIFEVYDPVANHWHALQSMPDGRELFGMAAAGPIVYVAGGLSSWTKGLPTATVFGFDTRSGAWQRAADLPEARSGLTLSAVGGALYAIGGRGSDGSRVYRYDPAADKWSTVGGAMPQPRAGHAAAVRGNRIFIIGGRGLDGQSLSRVDIFDTQTKAWSAGPNLPASIVSAAADFLGEQLHVAGGVAPEAKRTLTSHWVLAPSAARWAPGKPMPTARQGLTSAAVNGDWYLIGGGAGHGVLAVFTETDTVEVYTP
jgi:N-acetylneuraminic acid mutarotase